jgi:DHA2 family multidrug resistance protein
MKKSVSARLLLAIGLFVSALSLYLMSGFNLDASFGAVALPRIIQGFGIGLFFVPLAAVTFVGVRNEETGNASGIFNLLRNLGGSFGVAFCTTVLARRTQLHQTFLAEHVTPYNPGFQHYYHQIEQWLQIHQPQFAGPSGALGEIYRLVLRQAHMMAFNDTFWLLALATAALVLLTIFFRQQPGTARAAGVL